MPPEEVSKFIGQTVGSSVFEIEKEVIRRFADAVDDSNPFYWDEEYAKKSKHGSIIAPPGFISSPWFSSRPSKWPARGATSGETSTDLWLVLAKAGFSRVLDGGMEYDFFIPAKAGDTLTANTVIKNIVERTGATGKMAFLITETTYTNQNDELVAKARATTIHR